MGHWLVKSEPSVYSYARLEQEGRTRWDGVRNFEARNNLRAMALGDLCLYYHSVEEKALVGVAKVVKTAYPDPSAVGEESGDWSAVDLAPVQRFAQPLLLATVKATPRLAKMALLRRSRLSVTPVTDREFALITQLGTRGA